MTDKAVETLAPVEIAMCRALWNDDELIVRKPGTNNLAPKGEYEKDYIRAARDIIGYLAHCGWEITAAPVSAAKEHPTE